MATALDICNRALGLIGVRALGETLNAEEADDALSTLNTMLDSWSTQRLSIFVITQDILTLTPSQEAYTIGPASLIPAPDLAVTSRPLTIQNDSFIRMAGDVDYPLTILAPAQYRAIVVKDAPTSDLPLYVMYETTFPLGTLHFWPVPTAGTTLYLYSQQALTGFATLATTFSFPPGYQRAIEYSLAEELAPSYGITPLPAVMKTAAQARSNIKRLNYPDLRMTLPVSVLPQTGFGYYDYSAF